MTRLHTQPVHYELEIFYDALYQPLCENQRGIDAFSRSGEVEMTPDERFVTCAKCLKALGYDVAPDTGRVRIAA